MTYRSRLIVVAVAVVLTAMMTSLAGLASAAPNPPGNNGTIKIDDTPFDDAPDNEPHVGCSFQVDFYGYDEGDLDAQVSFEAHPPTGERQVLLTDTVFIGEDDNRGGGSEAGLDASQTYTLDLTGIEPHPMQGVHVKLTINAEGSQGADIKHKVFWVTGCGPGPTTTTTTTPGDTTTTSTSHGTGSSGATSTSESTTTSEATSTSRETTSTTSAVGGASSSAPGGGALPFTGAGGAMPLLAVGLALVGVGGASLLANNARRSRA